MKDTKLKFLKKMLLEEKSKCDDTLSRLKRSSMRASNISDKASYDLLVYQSNFHRKRIEDKLTEINYAIKKLDNNTYGVCEESGEIISLKRLLAIPWAKTDVVKKSVA